MDGLSKYQNSFKERREKSKRYLHSPAHVLADELATKLRDKKHFGYYLKMALKHDHQVLRRVMGEVLEGKDVKSPGKLFAFLLKKHDSK
jgi:hypothetical protein